MDTEGKSDDRLLDEVQRETFDFFLVETNERNGLADCTRPGWPCSIASTGLALASYPAAVERGWIPRERALTRTRTLLEFLAGSEQSAAPDATGYGGFYYHFLDMETGRRTWDSEVSTIDSAFLIAGALLAARYFDRADDGERRVRELADALYLRMDWRWAQAGGATVTHGWKPESGFLPFRWAGYSEALLLYALALGSPTHPVPDDAYRAWVSTYDWRTLYGYAHVHAGPLFIHQLSHAWIDFRGIRDGYMRAKDLDYFENSRRATLVQYEYATANPRQFDYYNAFCWGITAGDGPGPARFEIGGVQRTFLGYAARGAPFGPDDGTFSPWVVVASLPFAPEVVLPTIRHMIDTLELKQGDRYGFEASFNPMYPGESGKPHGWRSQWNYGINQGPIVLMVENHRSGLPWRLMRDCRYIVDGLRRAGFQGGWLG